MVNLDSSIEQILSAVWNVAPEFSAEESFPLITYSEADNACNQVIDGVEQLSDIIYLIEVWDDSGNLSILNDIAKQVSSVMVTNQFWRISSKTTIEPNGFHKKAMQFKTTAING